MRFARVLALAVIVAAPLGAQATPPRSAQPLRNLDPGFVLGADWLQANALPLDRDAIPSVAIDLSWRTGGWAFSAGWLRLARDLSTVQGGTLSAGKLLHLGPVLFIPAVSLLGGQTYASRDSTGYDFITGAVTGHQTRYSYSDGFTFGGGVGLTIEYPIFRALGIRVNTAEWGFSGHPLEDDRFRWVVGAGLSFRVRR